MAWFLVEIEYVPEKFAEVRPRHRDFLVSLAEQGVVAIAGPVDDDKGGVAMYQAENREELQKLIDQDPYHLEGAIAQRKVREFKPVIGAWLPTQ
ncbi:hypothetical protein DI005_31340 [Prauserella sp. PE36]|uniref:YciI family protein n=1 Tax=Prauserella sp. PE36 TaxID=1504709 RepID=UPI000DE47E67|nr:YciI family protein [Prauserella sp. PE36]RBM12939.1 hypothetical protein DI005_31340 [Prauserella sp. PE36]